MTAYCSSDLPLLPLLLLLLLLLLWFAVLHS
jgi:hypothetical protein